MTPPSARVTHNGISVAAGELPLTVARATGTGAAVVIVPSAFGVGPDLEAQMAELAADASLVATFDPFFRTDAGLAPYDDFPRVLTRLRELDAERCYGDLRAVIDWAHGHARPSSIVVVGVCFGGSYALRAAADGAAQGVVTWHGTRMENRLERAAEMRCPMRLHFGSADPVVPPAAVDAIRAAFAGRKDVHIVVHEGATHGFSHRGAPHAHDAKAEQAAMRAVRELIAAR